MGRNVTKKEIEKRAALVARYGVAKAAKKLGLTRAGIYYSAEQFPELKLAIKNRKLSTEDWENRIISELEELKKDGLTMTIAKIAKKTNLPKSRIQKAKKQNTKVRDLLKDLRPKPKNTYSENVLSRKIAIAKKYSAKEAARILGVTEGRVHQLRRIT